MFKKIKKRDGKIVNFNPEKITSAIAAAGSSTEEFKLDRAKQLAKKVLERAEKEITVRTPSVEQIQDIVEQVLMESSFKRTAKAYITYRQERNRTREAKSNLMEGYKKLLLLTHPKILILSVATPTLTGTPLWVRCSNLALKAPRNSPKPFYLSLALLPLTTMVTSIFTT